MVSGKESKMRKDALPKLLGGADGHNWKQSGEPVVALLAIIVPESPAALKGESGQLVRLWDRRLDVFLDLITKKTMIQREQKGNINAVS